MGSSTTEDLESFVEELKTVFEVMHIADIGRVELAAYQLKNVSRSWFDPWKEGRAEDAPPQKQKGPAPSSASAPAPRNKGFFMVKESRFLCGVAAVWRYSMEKIMSILQEYEKQSGQMINKKKSSYYVHQNILGWCCIIPEEETIDHLFLTEEFATRIWNYFSSATGIMDPMLNLKQFIRFRVNCGSSSWHLILSELEHHMHNISFRIVRCEPSPPNLLKCNTDGESKGNPGPSSVAFCIRDHSGNLVVAKGYIIQDTTNIVDEARAIRESLSFCIEHGIDNIIIETDSLAMVHILEGEWEVPWNVALEVSIIRRLRSDISARVKPSFREGNTLADFFANLVFSFAGDFQIQNFQEIPSAGKKLLNLDKYGTTYIRRKIQD
ncbi:uncharacterized protein LOC125817186 [Solanum verrucosum]|uniref:uncharacterized protein LOC125817186 n=1 Tax=Solanum verrucosum TaxID=315347 RepID=UPI0020D14DBB|nr:uncharacterized protein LOC125817186 [Solanum verrucosum]